MPPREGQRLIDKVRQLAAVTGYWPLVIGIMLIASLPHNRFETAHEECMRILGEFVRLSVEQQTASYQPAKDMVWQRGETHAKHAFIAGAVPIIWLASAIIFRKTLRRALHLDQPNDPQSVIRTSCG